MRCPACGDEQTRVVDSRTSADAIRRRRECLACGSRFTTFERVERRELWVLKSEGTKELFDRQKVARGVALACRKRGLTAEQLDGVVDQVVARLDALREPVVRSADVGEAVMHVLRDVDEVAYVRFASVYRSFQSVDQFVEAVAPLREEP